MRKLLSIFTAFVAVSLLGCLDVQEDVTINADGSGVYRTSADMSGLFDMMQMAAMMDTSANNELKQFSDKNIDSNIALGPIVDTATNLTAEEKALLKDATLHMVVNQNDRVFKMNMSYPFKKVSDIEKIIKLHEGGKGFNPMGRMKDNPGMGGSDGLPSAASFMDISFRNGEIERKINEEKLKEAQEGEDAKDLKKAEPMLAQIKFSTAIRLPKPVSKVKGDKVVVSDDKKTVLLKYNLLDVIKDPKSLEFKIEY